MQIVLKKFVVSDNARGYSHLYKWQLCTIFHQKWWKNVWNGPPFEKNWPDIDPVACKAWSKWSKCFGRHFPGAAKLRAKRAKKSCVKSMKLRRLSWKIASEVSKKNYVPILRRQYWELIRLFHQQIHWIKLNSCCLFVVRS